MATQAELQKAVDDTTAAANDARVAWKSAIPGADAPKMTDDEQSVVNRLEDNYATAKAARKAAEKDLRDNQQAAIDAATAAKAAAAVGTPVGSADKLSELDEKWILQHAGPRGLTDKTWADQIAGPRPDGWTGS